MFQWFTRNFRHAAPDGDDQQRLAQLIREAPIPVFWLFGKTQSGKTSIIKFMTKADDAEIGEGFRPCTRFSRAYHFPAEADPLLLFLDTRGLEEPGYDAEQDIAAFHKQAHVMIVTLRVTDFATAELIRQLGLIRRAQSQRPVVLALTCLHEAYPLAQHPQPYPFVAGADVAPERQAELPEELLRCVAQQRELFGGLVDTIVPIDLTPPSEGFEDAEYGGAQLQQALFESLPAAYRQTLLNLDAACGYLQDHVERKAMPHILGYSTLAATAGAIPIPWIDLLVLPSIQTQMIYHLAGMYKQRLSGQRFVELASTLGLGMLVRQGIRELMKFVPIIGSIAGATLAGSATFALGKAFCYYYGAVNKGHVPTPEELKHYYRDQLLQAERLWATGQLSMEKAK